MNPLETRGNLFTNGKFEAKGKFRDDEIPKEDWYEEQGIITSYKTMGLGNPLITLGNDDPVMAAYCDLLARPISDISDQEWAEMHDKSLASWNGREYLFLERWETFLHLLSIGVYPFDQSHFDDGTVIDINEV